MIHFRSKRIGGFCGGDGFSSGAQAGTGAVGTAGVAFWSTRRASGRGGAQAVCAPEIVGERLQANHTSNLGHRAYQHQAQASTFENAIDRLDPQAALIGGLAFIAGHAGADSVMCRCQPCQERASQ
jgi:hypothetical protein